MSGSAPRGDGTAPADAGDAVRDVHRGGGDGLGAEIADEPLKVRSADALQRGESVFGVRRRGAVRRVGRGGDVHVVAATGVVDGRTNLEPGRFAVRAGIAEQ